MIVDTHAHVIASDTARYPLSPLTPGRMSAWVTTRPATCEQVLAAMDAAGIERAVLVHSTAAYGYENRYEAECAARYPDRLCAVGGVDVTAADAREQIRYWTRDRGLAGMRIYGAGTALADDATPFLDDPKTFGAWETMRELQLPMVLQLRFKALARLERLLERFPDVPMIVDNLASPPIVDGPPFDAARALFALARFPNVFFKVTSIALLREWPGGVATRTAFLQRVVETFGADRVLWGSNFPGSPGTLGELLDLARSAFGFLSERDRQWVFRDTALRLYPRLGAAGISSSNR